MAPHSSTFAWKIPWTEEPGGLQSMGLLESDTTERLHFDFSLSCIGEGNGNPLHCSCLENPRDGGAWWSAVYGVARSRTRLKRLSSSSSLHVIIERILISNIILLMQECVCSVVSNSLWPYRLAHQAFLFMELFKQEYFLGDFLDPGIKHISRGLLHWQGDSLPLHNLGNSNTSASSKKMKKLCQGHYVCCFDILWDILPQNCRVPSLSSP